MKEKIKKNLLLSILILGALLFSSCGETSQKAPAKIEETPIYSTGEEIKVGKSIWKAVGIIKEGIAFKLPEGSESGKVYYKEPTDGKLIGVILDYINFSEFSFQDWEDNDLEAILIDEKNKQFKSLSYKEGYSIISAEEERKIDDYFNPKGTAVVIAFLYIVPKDSIEFKIKVHDETKYSNEEALIDLGL